MEHELKELKNAEGQETCTCVDCKKQFTSYKYDDECGSCRDGDYLFEREDYEGGSYYGTCPFCKGHGSFTMTEKKRCTTCKEYYEQEINDDDDY